MNNLQKLQDWMKNEGIDLFIVNRTDEFLNEYIAPYAERLAWLSNFTGSAGRLLIFQQKAVIFTDGRYTVQVQEEVDQNFFKIEHLKNFWNFFRKCLQTNFTIGTDSKLHSYFEIQKIEKILNTKKVSINYFKTNPIDSIWTDQPAYPFSQAFIHEEKYAGKSATSKIEMIQALLKNNSIDFYLLNTLDSIAWLLNIRGNDILYTPLLLSYVVIPNKGKIEFFVNNKKIQNIKNKLNDLANFHEIENIENFISNINFKKTIGIDEKRTPFFFYDLCKKHKLKTHFLDDPCIYLKARKNINELDGARRANARDAISIIKFLFWLKNEMIIKDTDEIKAAQYIEDLKSKNELYYSPSFETISAIGEHGALPHYRVTSKSNLSFKNNIIYLFDCGSQYRDGTTDITRTIVLGKPSKEQKDRFTRVLKGHIAIAKAVFKKNTKGSDLDPLARVSLNEINCDYDHGTGHGIGSFLSVHEGPQRIAKLSKENKEAAIMEGMILSNEPGYYKKGAYGIRIENLIIARNKDKDFLEFETISLVPIDIDLIDKNLLTNEEIGWLNNYHKKVYNSAKDYLSKKEIDWLQEVTKDISN